jgi:hypothetical protein
VQLSRRVAVLGVIAVVGMGFVACGDDDDEGTPASTSGGGEAVAPPPESAFRNFSAALEPQGLVVTQLPKGSLEGAEVGVSISGDRSGAGRSFPTGAEAQKYADEVAAGGDKSQVVGTVVFQAPSQEDLDFFVDAYEG